VHYLAVHDVIQQLEMRDIKGSHGLNRARERLTRILRATALAEVPSEQPKNPRTIETLSFAVVAETHRVSMCDHHRPGGI
jgi:hypothetical protein